MPAFSNEELLQIIATGESDRVEFKEALAGSAPTSIREAICAFANDLPGRQEPGFVFVGVSDDRRITGTDVTDQLLRQLADMKHDGNTVPPPSLSVQKRTLNNKDVAVIAVQPSDSPPVRFRGVIYIRTGSRRGIASAQDERILNERRRFGDRPFDIQPIPIADLTDLNLTQFENEYLTSAFADEVIEANDRTLQQQLAATKLIASADDPNATVLGILAIGKNPQDFLPGAYVQFLRIEGSDLGDHIVDEEEIRGSIPEVLRRLTEKLAAHNRIAVDILTGYTERRTELYPLEALHQFTRNAVMHRTYETTHAPIHVYWFDDRIEILSPGGPFGVVTADRFGEPGLVDYRNPNLADAMKTLGFVQRFGVGIPTARRKLIKAGYPEPEFQATESHVRVTVRQRSS